MPDGKIVAKLKYRKNDASVTIPVRLVQLTNKVEQSLAPWRGKGSKPTTTAECMFRVYYKECGLLDQDKGRFVEHTDIGVVHMAILGLLEEQHQIKWEPRIYVKVNEPYSSGTGDDAGIEVSWGTVYVATLPDGRVVHRGDIYGGTKIKDGLPRTGPDKKSRSRTEMRALIADTEENQKALAALADRINDVRDKLMDFLSPKKIEQGLASVAGLFLTSGEEGK